MFDSNYMRVSEHRQLIDEMTKMAPPGAEMFIERMEQEYNDILFQIQACWEDIKNGLSRQFENNDIDFESLTVREKTVIYTTAQYLLGVWSDAMMDMAETVVMSHAVDGAALPSDDVIQSVGLDDIDSLAVEIRPESRDRMDAPMRAIRSQVHAQFTFAQFVSDLVDASEES